MGTTVVTARPTRVVVLDVGALDNVVSLGVKPVSYAPSEGSPALPSYLKKDGGQPKSVGTINSLNLGAAAGLHPGLILGSQLRAAPQYAALSGIASPPPNRSPPTSSAAWRAEPGTAGPARHRGRSGARLPGRVRRQPG